VGGDCTDRTWSRAKTGGENSKDSDVTAKLGAIEAMEDSDDPKSIAALGEALNDQNKKVKEAALQALAGKKGANVTQMLRRGLNDPDPDFRIDVLEILADRGDLDSLRKAVADRNQAVRETAADLWQIPLLKSNPSPGMDRASENNCVEHLRLKNLGGISNETLDHFTDCLYGVGCFVSKSSRGRLCVRSKASTQFAPE
jgi:hypothetical protein